MKGKTKHDIFIYCIHFIKHNRTVLDLQRS